MDFFFFFRNRQVIAVNNLGGSFSSGTLATLPLPPGLPTFCCCCC